MMSKFLVGDYVDTPVGTSQLSIVEPAHSELPPLIMSGIRSLDGFGSYTPVGTSQQSIAEPAPSTTPPPQESIDAVAPQLSTWLVEGSYKGPQGYMDRR
jgi:hypothetical protein